MNPKAEYTARLAQRKACETRENNTSHRIGNLRLITAIAGVIIAFFVFGQVVLSPWWLIPPVAVFGFLIYVHARVDERLMRARRAIEFYEQGLARLDNRWMGQGQTGEQFRNAMHIYADDLDVFGKGSLFQLLSIARTHAGEQTLASWLLSAAPIETVMARQEAVRELRNCLDLRQDFAVLGRPAGPGLNAEQLKIWGERPRVLFPPALRGLAGFISVAVVVLFGLYLAQVLTRTPVLAGVLVAVALTAMFHKRATEVTEAVDARALDLELLAMLLRRLEQDRFQSPLLCEIISRIQATGMKASVQISRLQKLVERIDWEHNPYFRPVGVALLWRVQLAIAVERWRAISGQAIRSWIEAVGEFEALLSLAGYSYEHSDDPFPSFTGAAACFDAVAIGHPLMDERVCVRNNVRIGDEVRVLVISGSNMSGKSTLLRSVGLNTILALAGAPVRAEKLVLSPFALGVSIRVVDSLQDGKSRFYAEITRLRQIVDLTNGPSTVLFLIDELLSGTNSHDRQIGAEAIVRSLVDRGAVGMITTHDLALAHIADHLGPRGKNVHFADTVENGRLHFDYRLHAGVVRRSNALELMRSVGLEV